MHFFNGVHKVGIPFAFSQAHRPQATGLVEVAGRVLKDIIRNVGMEKGKSWIEISLCALQIRHDLIDPEIGFSPYQLPFGKERPGVGLPLAMEHEVYKARDWVKAQEQREGKVAKVLPE